MATGRLAGKTAIISGGAGSIGRSIATRFVAEGAQVLIADINLESAQTLAESLGDAARATHLDAYEEKSIAAMVNTAAEHFGGIDILVNNVADTSLAPFDTTVLETSVELWDKTFAADLRSYFLATKFVLPHMLTKGNGAIVHIASGAALAGDTLLTAYGAAKAGVLNFSRYVTAQYGQQGIRSNAICPGVIPSERNRERYAEMYKTAKETACSTRNGAPRDVASMTTYLASDEADFINGTTMVCDGGLFAAAPPWRGEMGSLA